MATKKLYDLDAYRTSFSAAVVSCVQKGNFFEVVLDETLFFPKEGGQTADKGVLGKSNVTDVQIKEDVITHTVEKAFAVGDIVEGKIDWQHRFFNMQQHSGEHIFSGLVFERYGYNNVGFHLSEQIVTMDFDGVLTKAQAEELEWQVNEAITANIEVKSAYPTKEELEGLKYRSKTEVKGAVRIVEIPGYDICACCAPHVRHTGEIGMFKIQSMQNYKGGVRISFLCGFRALMEYRRKAEIITELTGVFTTADDRLVENADKLKGQLKQLKGQLAAVKQELMDNKIERIPHEQKNVIIFERELEASGMRTAVNKLTDKHEGLCGIFVGSDENGYSFIIGSRNVDCRQVMNLLKEKFNARGGGGPLMVQGSLSGPDAKLIENLISSQM